MFLIQWGVKVAGILFGVEHVITFNWERGIDTSSTNFRRASWHGVQATAGGLNLHPKPTSTAIE
jgi:hypothetical protein